jgi:putative protease
MPKLSTIELLAPAGNWECARAAVENGADAIYFGLEAGFNARVRATNFHVRELPQLMQMLHRQGVLGYVTLNTLVFTDELPRLEENVRRLADAGVDAVLVQDLGVARLIRELCPAMVVHASTQMTLTHAHSIALAEEVGVQRVVLARELSLKEIAQITATTNMPVEVFVHGALCVAYSGQCLTSESLGGRSANRGQCAQACRLPYEVICDGEQRDLGNVKYLLSPQDLAAHDLVPELIAAGVCSMKIEGRLKTPEYVANTCQHYRQAIDMAQAGERRRLTVEQQRELELSFSRGFSPGWLEGCDHKRLVPGLSSSKRGVHIGAIVATRGDEIKVELIAPLATGDGIVIEGDRLGGQEIGGRVYELFQNDQRVDRVESGLTIIGLQRESLRDKVVPSGVKLWKTDDPQLTKRLRRSFDAVDPLKRVPIDVHLVARVGQPVHVEVSVADASPQTVHSEHVAEPARKHPLSLETLREQFSRLGGTFYFLRELTAEIEGAPMVPLSVLGSLRHAMVHRLEQVRQTQPLACQPDNISQRLLTRVAASVRSVADSRTPLASPSKSASSTLRVLCRSLAQLNSVLDAGVQHVIADFHDLRHYRQAVSLARQAEARLELATLRIHKPGEDGLFIAIAKHAADGWLVRSLAAIHFCRQHSLPFAADFSLNVTNPLTAEQLKQWGAERVTASYDLNCDQLFELAQHTPTDWLEVVIHQHMPMFHMEHCVFCSVLSPGKNKSDCGRPCDRHDVQLRDRVGAEHVLHADIGCRNTLYNGTAQSGAEAVGPLQELGINQFRVELLRDAPPPEVVELLGLYRGLLAGELPAAEVWRKLKAHNRVGVTRGTLEQPRNPLAIL